MMKEIYCTNITSHVVDYPTIKPVTSVTQSAITFTGFDLGELFPIFSRKIDLLFYNRVNVIGEVLSSLVYISNPLLLDDVSEKLYDIRKLYVNTDTERSMGITSSMTDFSYLNIKWNANQSFARTISPISDMQFNQLSSNGLPSVKLEKYGIAFDGWYTMMSVAVRPLTIGAPPNAPIKKNLLGYHTFAEVGPKLSILLVNSPAQVFADNNWSDYSTFLTNGTLNPDDSVNVIGSSLAGILTTSSVDNPYIKQELFILPTYLRLYSNSVIQYAETPTYGNPFPTLRNKHRMIHDCAKDSNYPEAQYILQTTDYFRMITHA